MVPVAWVHRFPEGSRLREWLLSWHETSARVAKEMERGPLGTQTAEQATEASEA